MKPEIRYRKCRRIAASVLTLCAIARSGGPPAQAQPKRASPSPVVSHAHIDQVANTATFKGVNFAADQLTSPGNSPHIDVTRLALADILAAYESGLFTANELMKAYLKHITRYEPAYNAFTFMNSRALTQAREVDRRRRAGDELGPLAGVPIVIKESMDVVGFPSTAGWARLSSQAGGIDLFPAQNATVVQRLIDAGAIIIGKTNIPAFSDDGTRANSSWDGPTYNAIDRSLAPGASSSGTATAVAASFAPAGLAEETGGSIQNPAGAQSLVGVKPTFGLVPTSGVVPLAGSTRDVVGPIAGTVRDAALILDVIAGYSPEDPKTIASVGHIPANGYTSQLSQAALQGKRLGLYGPGWRSLALSDETQALYESAIAELVAQGAVVIEDPFAGSGFAHLALLDEPYDYRGTESAAYDFTQYLQRLGVPSLEVLRQLIGVSPFDEGQPLRWYVDVLPALVTSLQDPSIEPDLNAFVDLKDAYLAIFNQVMAAHDLDALVFPQTTEAIPALFSDEFISETTVSAINIAGLPAVTVPAGQYGNRAPFSLIFVGPRWSEAELLGLAYGYEQATQHRIAAELITNDRYRRADVQSTGGRETALRDLVTAAWLLEKPASKVAEIFAEDIPDRGRSVETGGISWRSAR